MVPASFKEAMPSRHWRYLFWNAVIIAAIINFVLNGAIAWLSVRNLDAVPRWAVPLVDKPSTVIDTFGTIFLLPLFTCLVLTTLARRDVRKGRLPALGWTRRSHSFLNRLPSATLRRGLLLGALCTVILAPLTVLAIFALDVGEITVRQFVLYRALFALALGAIVTPVIALWAIAEAPGHNVPRIGS